ncbi:conserved hypothetical protein [delta proteobacterium NaphS2]|nr:conserved hypothetical protein [delta proteobacterium NaphS2]
MFEGGSRIRPFLIYYLPQRFHAPLLDCVERFFRNREG